MAVNDIVFYLQSNKGKYPLDILLNQLHAQGYPNAEIDQALSLISTPDNVTHITTTPSAAKKIGKFLLGFLGAAVVSWIFSFSLLAFLLLGGTSGYSYRMITRSVSGVVLLGLYGFIFYHYKSSHRFFAWGVLAYALITLVSTLSNLSLLVFPLTQ